MTTRTTYARRPASGLDGVREAHGKAATTIDGMRRAAGRSPVARLQKGIAMGLFASLLGLFGCDQQQVDKLRQQARDTINAVKPDDLLLKNLQPGVTTEDQIRAQMGKPEIVWENDDGSRRLEYPRSPNGLRTYMVDIGPDHKLCAVTQALTAENIGQVQPGMSEDEVRRLLGKPTTVAEFRLKKEVVWSWRWLEDGVNTPGMFNAHFGPGGRVVTTSRSPDPGSERP